MLLFVLSSIFILYLGKVKETGNRMFFNIVFWKGLVLCFGKVKEIEKGTGFSFDFWKSFNFIFGQS